jgi:hypothetical protein
LQVTAHVQSLWASLADVQVLVAGNEDVRSAAELAASALATLLAHTPLLSNDTSTAAALPDPLQAAVVVRPNRWPSEVTDGEAAAGLGGRSVYVAPNRQTDDVNSATVVRYELGLRDGCVAPPAAVAEAMKAISREAFDVTTDCDLR